MARKYHKAERTIELMGDLFAQVDYVEEKRRLDLLQPKTRGECHAARAAMYADLPDGHPTKEQAPCPWMRCRYHLHLDVVPVVIDGMDADEVVHHQDAPYDHTCVLDAVDALSEYVGESDPERAPKTIEEELADEEFPETNDGLATDQAIGRVLNMCDESVRLLWRSGLKKARRPAEARCT